MLDRIKTLVQEDTVACITTPTGLDSYGYGQVRVRQVMMKAHQVAYRLRNGDIPVGSLVRHTCDNRACINPRHLILGTVQDNSDDMKSRGRSAVENNAHAKLDWVKVREIRSSTEEPEILAERYGVKVKQIHRILRNEQWRDN